MKNVNITSARGITLLLVLFSFNHSFAQIFVEQTGALNPFDGEDVGSFSSPDFQDMDGDGDLDAFIGDFKGKISYYENTGDRATPQFTERNGSSNSMQGIDVGNESVPSFVDIDGDGDFDVFIGDWDGDFNYFENIGSSSSPDFVQRTGSQNPFNNFNTGRSAIPRFYDMDDDGDMDAVAGARNGKFISYENTGSATNPIFAYLYGPTCPLKGIDIGRFSSPSIVDLDDDGDFDIMTGEEYGRIYYIMNIGSKDAPDFELKAAAENPLDGEDVGVYSVPIFVDLNDDGYTDMVTGSGTGRLHYFTRAPNNPLPIELVSFDAELKGSEVNLRWSTASETNNDYFTVERSRDGQYFESIGTIPGAGNSVNTLYYRDVDNHPCEGQSYYRLKQTDFDGEFSYSRTVAVNNISTLNDGILVYPNPVQNDNVFVMADNIHMRDFSLDITDLSGRSVFHKSYKDFTWDQSVYIEMDNNVIPGIYMLILNSGELSYQERLVVK